MLKNYRVALRNLTRDRTSSLVNLGGLSVGMAVAMLIGFWVYSELTFNKSFDCTVSIQAIKAALTNPVKSLRTE